MYIGRANSQVRVSNGTFGNNHVANRGGVIVMSGKLTRSDAYLNTAMFGGVISACGSNIMVNVSEKLDTIKLFFLYS